MRPTTLLLLILMITLDSTIGFIVVVVVPVVLHVDGKSYITVLERINTEDLFLLPVRPCIPVVIKSLVPRPLLKIWQITQYI